MDAMPLAGLDLIWRRDSGARVACLMWRLCVEAGVFALDHAVDYVAGCLGCCKNWRKAASGLLVSSRMSRRANVLVCHVVRRKQCALHPL